MNRRNMLRSATALASVAALAACATTPAQAQANATKVVTVAQAGFSTLTAELRIFNVTLTGAALTAYNALSAAITGLSNIALTDAKAIATFVTAPTSNVTQLLTDAATLVLGVLRVIPGASSAVGLVEDVIAAAPLVSALAQVILTPATVAPTAAVNVRAREAAARLGVAL